MNSTKEKIKVPSIFVIMGATGDLASRKIIPSLWHLFAQGRLPERLSVIGFSRQDISDEAFRSLVRKAVLARGGAGANEKDLVNFESVFSYHAGSFENADSFQTLSESISKTETTWGLCANKLFYLATPPITYESIFKNLAGAKLNIPCGGELGWSRILIEKPFGSDIKSAQALQSLLSSYFKDEQIYRIDHYLAKEIVQGIENFRFSNNLFENAWDNTMIERIDIRLLETIGAEGRGAFYDAVGALRDVGQNHLLMMLSAITMEYPPRMEAENIRKSRASLLGSLREWTDENIRRDTFRAQYKGYKHIEGVKPNSETETYFVLKTELLRPRFKSIPVFLEAGKLASKEARKEIVLTLKHPPVCLLCEAGPHAPNRITFRLEPNDEIIIHFWTKKPGFEQVLEGREFSFFLYEKENKVQYVEEYAKLLYAAMEGNQALFVSSEEIEALWKFTDPVVRAWARGVVSLKEYEPNANPSPALLAVAPDALHAKPAATGVLGMIGLGKMGAGLARNLAEKGWKIAGLDHSIETTRALEAEGVLTAFASIPELVRSLKSPRIVWVMVPSGKPVEDTLFGKGGLLDELSKGDIVIDGGNSFYKDSMRRAEKLAEKGIRFIDVGVSGGPGGARNGACLMIGGNAAAFAETEVIFRTLALPGGYQFFEGAGAGHFVKMVHNGIEYGMMQAIAEGFDIMKTSAYHLDLSRVTNVYNHGSVIEARLIGWLEKAFALHGENMDGVSGSVAQTGEGKWTVEAAKEMGVKAKILEAAVTFRTESEKHPSYAGKVLSALREQFGGHSIKNSFQK